jgi:hypothetical protein
MKTFPLLLMSIFALATTTYGGGPSISVAVSPPHVTNEGEEATFTFTLSAPSSRKIAMNFLLSGAATLGNDYILIGKFNKTGQLVIPAHQTGVTVTLHTLVQDIENDPQPQFAALNIVDGPRYRAGTPSQAIVRIENVN